MEGDLRWRIERACRAAWPPHAEAVLGDWIVPVSPDGTRRGNSATPAVSAPGLDAAALARIEAHHREAGRTPQFRLPGFVPAEIHLALDAAGYAPPSAETVTLFSELGRSGPVSPRIIVRDSAGSHWLAARRRLADPHRDDAPTIALIRVPTGFARIEADGAIAALGFVAVSDGIAVLEAIATDPALRRRGHARLLTAALLDWARAAGARHVALQVMADNAPALALYRGLGIDRTAYLYHYRRRE